MSGIILTVNLQGAVAGPVKHTDLKKVTIQLNNQELISRTIQHTDRKIMECTKVTHLSEEVIDRWENDECPPWEEPRKWKKMNRGQRLFSYLEGFDEGFGFSFEFIEQ